VSSEHNVTTRRAFRGLLLALALAVAVSCGKKTADTLAPRDAARWLHLACGITFAQDPVVLKSSPPTRQRALVAVSATVVLPDSEVAGALAALWKNRSLHRRGQSETRYSYQSFPGVIPETECELDTALHVLYFRYTGPPWRNS
jgi:hypothetical protein